MAVREAGGYSRSEIENRCLAVFTAVTCHRHTGRSSARRARTRSCQLRTRSVGGQRGHGVGVGDRDRDHGNVWQTTVCCRCCCWWWWWWSPSYIGRRRISRFPTDPVRIGNRRLVLSDPRAVHNSTTVARRAENGRRWLLSQEHCAAPEKRSRNRFQKGQPIRSDVRTGFRNTKRFPPHTHTRSSGPNAVQRFPRVLRIIRLNLTGFKKKKTFKK